MSNKFNVMSWNRLESTTNIASDSYYNKAPTYNTVREFAYVKSR